MIPRTLESLCSVNPETLGANTAPDFEFRYLDISSVTEGKIDWKATQVMRLFESPSRARRVVRRGDVLLCTVRPGLQSHAIIHDEQAPPVVCSTGFAVLRPKEDTDSSYIFHSLFGEPVAAQLRGLETGSNYPAVNENDVRGLRVPTPSPPEMRRIGAVLDSVDETVARTEAVIAKLKQVRAGLLHDLLTCGLDENGQLRDPIAHPDPECVCDPDSGRAANAASKRDEHADATPSADSNILAAHSHPAASGGADRHHVQL